MSLRCVPGVGDAGFCHSGAISSALQRRRGGERPVPSVRRRGLPRRSRCPGHSSIGGVVHGRGGGEPDHRQQSVSQQSAMCTNVPTFRSLPLSRRHGYVALLVENGGLLPETPPDRPWRATTAAGFRRHVASLVPHLSCRPTEGRGVQRHETDSENDITCHSISRPLRVAARYRWGRAGLPHISRSFVLDIAPSGG